MPQTLTLEENDFDNSFEEEWLDDCLQFKNLMTPSTFTEVCFVKIIKL